jgi:hypothetical protein
MYINEELLTDKRYQQLHGNKQSELIANHCVDIEDRIRSAPSRLEAVRLKELECAKFKQDCQSTLVRTALARYVEELISCYWDKKKIKKGNYARTQI